MFTLVDDGYDVKLFTSLKALWESMEFMGLLVQIEAPSSVPDMRKPLTYSLLRKHLDGPGATLRLYRDGTDNDWYLKAQRQR